MAFRWIGKSSDGSSVTLRKLDESLFQFPPYATTQWCEQNTDLLRKGIILDVETTGLSHNDDSIIEIALRVFSFNKQTGEVLSLNEEYSSFQDPGRPLRPEIIQLTGISDADVEGQKIDWQKVDSLLNSAHLIIAHNARFDRPFIEKHSKLSGEKIWGCSLKQIDWAQKGFFSSKLELLNIYHGFFVDAHRAINDVNALLYLLSLPAPTSESTLSDALAVTQPPYLLELINNARKNTTQVIASSSPFETKDLLKGRGYNWDNTNKFWHRFTYKEELSAELKWLEENVYLGPFRGFTREIPLVDNFKN